MKQGSWTCQCGRVNPPYTGTCACGRTRLKPLQLETDISEPGKATDFIENLHQTEPPVTEDVTASVNQEISSNDISTNSEIANLQKIKMLKELLDSGAITIEEYELKKKEYLRLQ